MYASSGFDVSVQKQFVVSDELNPRLQEFWGTFLPWGADGFLGSGIMKEFRAVFPQFWQYPPVYISQSTDITFSGNVIRLIPTGASSDGLIVYLLAQDILDMGEFIGWQLPDVALLPNDGYTIDSLIASLENVINLEPNSLLLKTGKPIFRSASALAFLQDQRDTLLYIRDQTILKANQHYTLDEIMATLKLPDSLTSSGNLTGYASDVPSIVREVWNEYLGWWGGNPTELASTLNRHSARHRPAGTLRQHQWCDLQRR
jgi:alkyl sulfatase BDS1-like metallo-beta-lactamase superfamily hydrolase